MKMTNSSFALLLLIASALLVDRTTAFVPSLATPVRTTTARPLVDPYAAYHAAMAGHDAVRVILMDCNDMNCHMVDGIRLSNGVWQFHDRMGSLVEAAPGSHNQVQVLMMELADSE